VVTEGDGEGDDWAEEPPLSLGTTPRFTVENTPHASTARPDSPPKTTSKPTGFFRAIRQKLRRFKEPRSPPKNSSSADPRMAQVVVAAQQRLQSAVTDVLQELDMDLEGVDVAVWNAEGGEWAAVPHGGDVVQPDQLEDIDISQPPAPPSQAQLQNTVADVLQELDMDLEGVDVAVWNAEGGEWATVPHGDDGSVVQPDHLEDIDISQPPPAPVHAPRQQPRAVGPSFRAADPALQLDLPSGEEILSLDDSPI